VRKRGAEREKQIWNSMKRRRRKLTRNKRGISNVNNPTDRRNLGKKKTVLQKTGGRTDWLPAKQKKGNKRRSAHSTEGTGMPG